MQNLLQNMMDSVSLAQATSDVTYQVLTGEIDVPVIYEGTSIPTLSTRVRDYLRDAVENGDLDGTDGISIEEFYIREDDGHLMVRLTGQDDVVSLGKIVPEDGVGIDYADYDSSTGHLDFVLEDGKRVPVGNIRGNDGYRVVDAVVRGTNLYINTRDVDGNTTQLDAGDISRFGGISANDVEIKENGNLTVIFSDGSVRDLGRVVGRDGQRGPSVQSAWLNQNGQLQFLRSDGTQFATNPINLTILDGTGNTIEDMDMVNGELRVKLSADNDYRVLGRVQGQDGTDGKDGVMGDSVEDVSIDEGQVLVKLSHEEAPRSVGEAVFYEAGDNSLRLTQAVLISDENDPNYGKVKFTLDINGVDVEDYVGPVIGTDGKDGKVIESASINAQNELVLVDEDGKEMNAGKIPQGRIRAIDFNDLGTIDIYEDEEKNNLLVTLNGPAIKGRDGVNGFGIVDITKDEQEGTITFHTENPDTGAIGEYTVSVVVPHEVDARKIGGYLRVTLSDGTEFSNLVKLDGEDGEVIRDVRFVNGEMRIDTNKDNYTWDIDYRMPTNPTITSDGKLKFEFTDGSDEVETTERVAALDGDTITSVTLEDDNSVLIKYTTDNRDGDDELKIPFVRGTGIYDFDIEDAGPGTNPKLKFKTNDANPHNDHTIEIPRGIDGYTITKVEFNDPDLIIEHTYPSDPNSVEIVAPNPNATPPVVGVYRLTLEDVRGTTITDISPGVNPDNGEDSIMIRLSNGDNVHLEKLEGKDATGIVSIDYDNNDNSLKIKTTDHDENDPLDVISVENFKGIDGDRVESITEVKDDDGNVTGFRISYVEGVSGNTLDYSSVIPVIYGLDGFGIEPEGGISVEGDASIKITTNDGNSLSWPQQKGEDADWTLTDIKTGTSATTGNPTIIFVDNFGVEHEFEQQKGRDAEESLKDITYDGTSLVVEHISGNEDVVRLDNFKGVDGETITDITVDGNDLVIEATSLDNPIRIEQIKGADGNSIEDISFDETDLVFTTNVPGKETVTVPLVRGEDGVTINDITFDSENAKLIIDLSDREEPLEFPQVKGKDGTGIEDIRFDSDTLVVELNDEESTTIEIPLMRGSDGDRITNIELVDEEETYVSLEISEREEPVKLPIIKGVDGYTIHDITINDDNSISLVTSLPEKENIKIDAVKGSDGHGITDVTFSEEDHILSIKHTDSSLDQDIKIPKAVDGDTIRSMDSDPNNPSFLRVETVNENTYIFENIFGIDGKDGKNIKEFIIDKPNDGDLTIVMDDEVIDDNSGDVITPATEHVLEGYAREVEDVDVTDDKKLSIKFKGVDEAFITDHDVVGRDGEGRGVHSAEFDDGVLKLTFKDASGIDEEATEIGSVRMNNVLEAKIDDNTGMLTFVMDDGSERDVGIVFGRDGRFVENVRVESVTDDDGFVVAQNLIMILDNGDEIDAGNIKGDAGRSIIGAADPTDPNSENGIEVLQNGDIIVRYDNGDAEPVGNIGGGMGLTVWESGEEYELDRVVIHDGGMYMSDEAENTDEPPSDKWRPLAMGDQIVEVRRPVIESPKDGNIAFSMAPRLIASVYAPIVSGDEREYREFQVSTETDAAFEDNIVYSYTTNADIHETRNDLQHNTKHYWRCRDLTVRGSYSRWSEIAEFETPEGRVERPDLKIHDDENANSTFNAPMFVASDYENRFNSEGHQESDWHIIKVVGIDDNTGQEITEEVLFNVGDTENLEEYIVHYDLLDESTTYRIRVKYRANTIESLWSEWVEFTTEEEFTYIQSPAIDYDGSLEEVKVFNPEFKMSAYAKTDRFAAKSAAIGMPHTSTDWEVRLLSNNSIVEENFGDTVNLRSYAVQATLSNETRYLIRGRFYNERFGYSEWTEWQEFRTLQRIDTPTGMIRDANVNTGEPLPDGTVLSTSDFSAINETHVATEWRFLDIENGDAVVYSTGNDTINLVDYPIDITLLADPGEFKTFTVSIRHIGNDIESDYGFVMDGDVPMLIFIER